MEPVIMLLAWRWEADHGLCMVGQYVREQEAMSPLGWPCVVAEPQPCRTSMLMPIVVVEVDMQACLHVGWVGVMHGLMNGSPHAWVRAEQTRAISNLEVGPVAALRMLSLNCAQQTALPRDVSHKGCCVSENLSVPSMRRKRLFFCLPDEAQVGSLGAERSAHGDGGTSAPKLPNGLGIDVICEGEFN